MNETKKINFYFYGSLFLAIWFALTGFIWTYLANIFISFPFGVLSFYLLNKGKQIDPNKSRYWITISFLVAGGIVSLIALMFFK
jgi:hypothetical protein